MTRIRTWLRLSWRSTKTGCRAFPSLTIAGDVTVLVCVLSCLAAVILWQTGVNYWSRVVSTSLSLVIGTVFVARPLIDQVVWRIHRLRQCAFCLETASCHGLVTLLIAGVIGAGFVLAGILRLGPMHPEGLSPDWYGRLVLFVPFAYVYVVYDRLGASWNRRHAELDEVYAKEAENQAA